MKKLITLTILILVTVAGVNAKPKYIFYFIGDGMGFNHVQMTQAAIAARAGTIGYEPLTFTKFPIFGLVTTHAATRLTTDSAAAGTALAAGEKTSVGTIGMNEDHTEKLESVAVVAHKMGMKVGILTTVSIDHATPAAFFAHEKKRNMYTEIAGWITKSGFDLFAGSGLIGKAQDSMYHEISQVGKYKIVRGANATLPKARAVWVQELEKSTSKLPYAIDRKAGDMTLPLMVEKAIGMLYNAREGFFIMAEGGQIDWAAHDNDAATVVQEVADMDAAVAVALEFYKKHPTETLIVVTADHETGGLALGRSDRGYETALEKLYDQKASRGIVGDSTAKAIMKQAGVAFTTGAHTAAPVPVYAIGCGAKYFQGIIDNTAIPRAIKEIIKED